DVSVPGSAEWLAVHAHVSTNQQRPPLGEQHEVLGVIRRRLRLRARRTCPSVVAKSSEREAASGDHRQQNLHDSTSLIGLASASTRRMGRPTFDWFCFVMSRPSALQTVPSRSDTETGRSLTSMPSGLVLPTTCPPLIPPPHSTVD